MAVPFHIMVQSTTSSSQPGVICCSIPNMLFPYFVRGSYDSSVMRHKEALEVHMNFDEVLMVRHHL